MIMDQIGNDPSVLLPSSIGRFILGFEAIETNRNTNDAYKNGIANNLNPMLLITTKIMKLSNDFKNINLEIPQFIFFLVGFVWRLEIEVVQEKDQMLNWVFPQLCKWQARREK